MQRSRACRSAQPDRRAQPDAEIVVAQNLAKAVRALHPGKLRTPDYESVEREFERARSLLKAGDSKILIG